MCKFVGTHAGRNLTKIKLSYINIIIYAKGITLTKILILTLLFIKCFTQNEIRIQSTSIRIYPRCKTLPLLLSCVLSVVGHAGSHIMGVSCIIFLTSCVRVKTVSPMKPTRPQSSDTIFCDKLCLFLVSGPYSGDYH